MPADLSAGPGPKPSPDPAGRRSYTARRLSGPGWLIVGTLAKRSAQAELACSIIRRLTSGQALVGLEVTVLPGGHGRSRGGRVGRDPTVRGFSLVEEGRSPRGKATAAMRQAGARRVLWLRTSAEALAEGFEAVRAEVGDGALVVAASNSLRRVVDPDLFLMVGRPRDKPLLPSAREVMGFVDRWVGMDRGRLSPWPIALEVNDGRWCLDEPTTAVVLAGGRSRRMGAGKHFLRLAEGTLLERVVSQVRPLVAEVVIGANDPGLGRSLGLRTVPDRVPGQGPLMALASALAVSSSDRNLLVACDLPEIPAALVRRLLEATLTAEAAIPLGAEGKLEPLLAVYRRRLLPDAERLLAAGERRLRPLFEGCRTEYIDLAIFGLESLPNLNTREEYVRYLKRRGRAR